MLLDVYRASERLGVSTSTVRNLIRREELPIVRVGRRVLVEVAAIERFVAERRAPAEDDAAGGGPAR